MHINCVHDSCIINIYEPGDYIPPHIDSHDFVRPFSTLSCLSECNIIYVFVLNGNKADFAKNCIPTVSFKRYLLLLERWITLSDHITSNLIQNYKI
ncbi:hypothetical protein IEQ34_007587 [Dendrobium chrysotoxum]|uniref:Prolyl 4-hydroxylase alpha subunit Fe(2+) 2OG dioxygenase domain-containing protein n=1 Tax=Dendrobium chrysotoxum TaxID=161865 RepID=A0AAV7GMA6_DENCH|nr:hypothetical protein IEQ34_007587 [Dendrobium chrysotoxum]